MARRKTKENFENRKLTGRRSVRSRKAFVRSRKTILDKKRRKSPCPVLRHVYASCAMLPRTGLCYGVGHKPNGVRNHDLATDPRRNLRRAFRARFNRAAYPRVPRSKRHSTRLTMRGRLTWSPDGRLTTYRTPSVWNSSGSPRSTTAPRNIHIAATADESGKSDLPRSRSTSCRARKPRRRSFRRESLGSPHTSPSLTLVRNKTLSRCPKA